MSMDEFSGTQSEGLGVPNARAVKQDGDETKVTYAKIGDHLKLEYHATRPDPESGKHWIEFNPANIRVELNGQPLTTCQEIEIWISEDGLPHARLSLNLESIDIDMDTLTHLTAFANQKKLNDAGYATLKPHEPSETDTGPTRLLPSDEREEEQHRAWDE